MHQGLESNGITRDRPGSARNRFIHPGGSASDQPCPAPLGVMSFELEDAEVEHEVVGSAEEAHFVDVGEAAFDPGEEVVGVAP